MSKQTIEGKMNEPALYCEATDSGWVPIDKLPASESDSQSPTTETFKIDSDEKAEWLLRKLANLEAEIERVTKQARAIIEKAENEKKHLLARFQVELEDHVRAKLNGTKGRSVKYLQGTVGFRTVPGGLRLTDTVAAMQYALGSDHEGLIESTPTLNRSLYRSLAEDALKATGEILPGCEIAEPRETFTIKFPTSTSEKEIAQ